MSVFTEKQWEAMKGFIGGHVKEEEARTVLIRADAPALTRDQIKAAKAALDAMDPGPYSTKDMLDAYPSLPWSKLAKGMGPRYATHDGPTFTFMGKTGRRWQWHGQKAV